MTDSDNRLHAHVLGIHLNRGPGRHVWSLTNANLSQAVSFIFFD